MRIVIIGAGLGGLGAALRLQGAGHDVVVVEGRDRPGGRAYQLQEDGFTWDTGPSLITMPWVLEETFAAGGLDLHAEVTMRELDPFYRIFWGQEEQHLDFVTDREAMKAEIAKFSSKDAAAFDPFMEALRPIYEEGILGAGRRPFLRFGDLARFTPKMVQLGAAMPLWRMVAKHFEHPRIREAFSFHSLFIGGDPYRVPAIYGALVYLQFLDRVWYTDGGVYALIDAMARTLDVRCGERVQAIEHRGDRVTGVRLEGGERIAADLVVSNADVLTTHELVGRKPPLRRLTPTMSCFLLYLGTDRVFDKLQHHTLLVGDGYKQFIHDVTRGGRLPSTYSTYVHAPQRTEAAMAPDGGDSIAVLLPVPNLRSGIDWEREEDRLRDALVRDMETTFGLSGLDASVRVEKRMTPVDFQNDLGAAFGNAFAIEPTLQQSAWFRQPNRDRALEGLYYVGGGTHPGAGIPGVLLGAEVTTNLIAADHPAPSGRRAAVASA
ncbi:phytoene desaturase family protein [Patulibacter sp. SYSU D01012]|uniref:phytoene desaturase family protein n=1 Tax=Patulibacter sp. SYSU D01012 TaxID=2817381 RepID=UPI001B303AB4|nr:phytoene desaturase family protein [Patulibacter sp. SYSU D01012]